MGLAGTAAWDPREGAWRLLGAAGGPGEAWCCHGAGVLGSPPGVGRGEAVPVMVVRFGRDCYPLWVGNITSRITEKVLRDCFSR